MFACSKEPSQVKEKIVDADLVVTLLRALAKDNAIGINYAGDLEILVIDRDRRVLGTGAEGWQRFGHGDSPCHGDGCVLVEEVRAPVIGTLGWACCPVMKASKSVNVLVTVLVMVGRTCWQALVRMSSPKPRAPPRESRTSAGAGVGVAAALSPAIFAMLVTHFLITIMNGVRIPIKKARRCSRCLKS